MHHIIGKGFAIVMVPLSLLIVIQEIGLFKVNTPFDKLLIGAILMISLEVITLIGVLVNYQKLGVNNILAFVAFLIPPILYLASVFFVVASLSYIPLILGVTMFGETIYALGI